MTPVPMPRLTDEQRSVIQALKIPVDSFNPGIYWIASIDRDSSMPTDAELRMIRSYIDFSIRTTYNQTYQERILAKPFPAEGGHVTKIFRKGSRWLKQNPIYEKNGQLSDTFSEGARHVNAGDPCEGWVYRRITWDGSECWPTWPAPRLSLIELLDYINSSDHGSLGRLQDETWVAWKMSNADIFPGVRRDP